MIRKGSRVTAALFGIVTGIAKGIVGGLGIAAVISLLLTLSHDSAGAISYRTLLAPVGEMAGDLLGTQVASAGDVNGDGYDDIVVGAPYHDYPGTEAGAAYVYFGGPAADASYDLVLYGEAALDHFGSSVGSAGDVNGDGYADLIVGAPDNDAGGDYAGRMYLYLGGPSFDGTPFLTLTGEAAWDRFGSAAGTAGDMNGDGYADVMVGAPGNDAGGVNAGRAYIYFGGPNPDGTPDLTITQPFAGDGFGTALGTAGDVNGDGYADVIVGAPYNDVGGFDVGRAYVYYGGLQPDTFSDAWFVGTASGDELGCPVGTAGDINGDGYADVIVGARGDDAGGTDVGRAYVYFGGSITDGTPDVTLTGAVTDNHFPQSIGTAGDVNGDGYADLIAGSYATIPTRALIYLGGPYPDPNADLVLPADGANDGFGASVASAGDVNGDGFAEIVVGAPNSNAGGHWAGRATVLSLFSYKVLAPNGGDQWVSGESATVRWLGRDLADLGISLDGGLSWTTLAAGIGGQAENEYPLIAPDAETDRAMVRLVYKGQTATRSNSDASDGAFRIVRPKRPPDAASRVIFAARGDQANDQLGTSAASAGDVNGDGYDDVIVGAPRPNGGGVEYVYIHFGGPGAHASPDLTLTGSGRFGWSVGTAGDMNGDGFDDVIVGAPRDGQYSKGRAYVYYGGSNMDASADVTLDSRESSYYAEEFGYSVGPAGDVNGDGYADVIVGAPFYSSNDYYSHEGAAYVFYGGPNPSASQRRDLSGAGEADQHFGLSVGTAGDVNGDGFADVIVGSPTGSGSRGRAHVFLGPYLWEEVLLNGSQVEDGFGSSVGTAGDLDGDGYADVIVGAPLGDAVQVDVGRAFVFRGGPQMDADPDIVITGVSYGDQFGSAVGTAGDVNGDGHADFVVGAVGVDAGETDAGRAYVYYGGPGADTTPDFVVTGAAAGEQFGWSVGTAGDMNGDGHADVIVGAPYAAVGGTDAGRVCVYDFNRYFVVAPNGGETWNMGTTQTVTWLGSEPADLWLSVNAGQTYDLLRSRIGGSATNSVSLTVPAASTRFALVKLTPANTETTGSDESDAAFSITSPTAAPAVRLQQTWYGPEAGDTFGLSVSALGDIYEDGYATQIVGAPGADGGNGAAYIYGGGPRSLDVTYTILTGEGGEFGSSVAAAGDVNGDGVPDLIIGAPNYSGGYGRVYLFYGGSSLWSTPAAEADVILTSDDLFQRFGVSVSTAGDVNGDGFADVIVGSSTWNETIGRAYIFYGGPNLYSKPAAEADVILSGESYWNFFGNSVAAAGDVNGDGRADVIVGNSGGMGGLVGIFYGGTTLHSKPASEADVVLTGGYDYFGYSVASAGDVNGDGRSDVIVGAYDYDASTGRAHIFYGGPTLVSKRAEDADVILTGDEPWQGFGFSVASAGDANADGYGDVIVGSTYMPMAAKAVPGAATSVHPAGIAKVEDSSERTLGTGHAHVFYGGPTLVSGPAANADIILTGEGEYDNFGVSVSSAGDVNHDGFPDLLVGAGVWFGAAYLYDVNRYQVVSPMGGETWNVGATMGVSWLGAEPADLWLSVDGGRSYDRLKSKVGGSARSSVSLLVPHTPTRFARVRLTPSNEKVFGSAESDSLFTIQTSISLLEFRLVDGPQGGTLLTWSTSPTVGPDGIAGYRLYRLETDAGTTGTRLGPTLITETQYTDMEGAPGMGYRLAGVNGLGEELELGRVSPGPVRLLSARPLPYRGGDLHVSFAIFAPIGATGGSAEVGLYNTSGRLVKVLASGTFRGGRQAVTWNGRDEHGDSVPSGVYFLRASSGGQISHLKLTVVR